MGLAVGDSQTGMVEPLKQLNTVEAVKKIGEICVDKKIKKIVVGGSEKQSAQESRWFAEQLKKFGITVDIADETLSTKDAQQKLRHLGSRKRARKEHSAAAAVILESWLGE